MQSLVTKLKEHEEDFEFYPTTPEMIRTVFKDFSTKTNYGCNSDISLLDIGAGNGNVFSLIDELNPKLEYGHRKFHIKKLAIEKSRILCEQLPPDVYILGTEFMEQSLIDKRTDIIFCNPPYSEYVAWTRKILAEANCAYIYLIIPQRWKEEKVLLNLLERRNLEYNILKSTDFLDSEYRKARAKVDIIRFDVVNSESAFGIWFDEYFQIQKLPEIEEDTHLSENLKKEKIHKLVSGHNLVERLSELYREDLNHLLDNYKKVEQLDPVLMKELGIHVHTIKSSLEEKIKGLKNLYWHELFDNMKSLTDRLTKKSRDAMLKKLFENTSVDFTENNAYAIVLWAIKNANLYIGEQLLDVYRWMSRPENVKNYKSNIRMVDDKWRYLRADFTHYQLEYRLVIPCYYLFKNGYSFDMIQGLHKDAHDHIKDIFAISRNLGFHVNESTKDFQWVRGKEYTFTFGEKKKVFLKIRGYANGNIHCKFDQNFMKKVNIEAGRLSGWVKSPKEASEEMDIPLDVVKGFYGNNLRIEKRDMALCLPLLSEVK